MTYAVPTREARSVYTSTWYWRTKHGDRKDTCCCVLTVGAMNSALVMFPDGLITVTSRYAVRPLPPRYDRAGVDAARAALLA